MVESSPQRTLLLVRFASEISTKARKTRQRFHKRLAKNIRDALESAGIEHSVNTQWNRIFVEADTPEAVHPLTRVFGISSVSPVEARVPAQLDTIVETGKQLFQERVKGKRYAVDCHRIGRHPFRSHDLKVALGSALNPGATVDLNNPEVMIEVEIRDDEAWLFSRRFPGPGGLPLGVQGRAVCLMSGGFDSPVAAWMLLKRGVRLDYVFCNLAGAAYERAVLTISRMLVDRWGAGDHPKLHVIDFEGVVQEMKEKVTPRYWQVVLKRLMYAAADQVAKDNRADAVVTGESLGQVSSQTLGNLRAIDDASELPVFRPLLGLDKIEIIERANSIGTGALSARIQEYCAILPTRPVTHSKPLAAKVETSKMDPTVLSEAVRSRRILDLRALEPKELVEPYIFADEVPTGAMVLDCRPQHHWETWHYPGASRWDPQDLLGHLGKLEKDEEYLLYCDLGVQTAQIAEIMQRVGFDAYSFRGGTRALRKWTEASASPAPSGTS